MPWRLTPLAAGEAVELVLHAPIGEMYDGSGVSSRQVIEALNKVPRAREIRAFINSGGGFAFDGMAIYSALARHPARVVVEIEGVAASAASIIAMAGDVIRVAESGFVMIHDAWGMALGNGGDMRRAADDLDRLCASMAEVYAARSKQTVETVRAAMQAETWFSGREAVAWGLATEVVANKKAAACAIPAQLLATIRNLPPVLSAPVPAANQGARPLSRAEADALRARTARINADLAAARARRSGT
jgi:ATP-dependent Clp protease, protease subunit